MFKFSRRFFLYATGLFATISVILGNKLFQKKSPDRGVIKNTPSTSNVDNLGVAADGKSYVFIAKNHSPETNIQRAIEGMGGIDKYVGKNDIVILKPNAQWWNQGTTNTNNMKGFIEIILNRSDFTGEIIIAENHHYKKPNSRGWSTEERNGDFNLNELIHFFNDSGYQNVSKYHWVDGGANPQPQEGDGGNGEIVETVEQGDGYVWLSDVIYTSPEGRKCIMTYPVFTSSYSGKKIDLHRGSLQNGAYVDNVRFINFSCLNHHSHDFGVTASIKNLMGVPDMTCGYQGPEPKGYYNIHFIGNQSPLYKAGRNLKYYGRKLGVGPRVGKKLMRQGYWSTQYTGGALGYWLKHVRMPDLNILAAEYVGWGGRGRQGPQKRAKANCVAISTDPVALDYVGAKEILLKATPKEQSYYRMRNSPDNPPFHDFLRECHKQGIGNLLQNKIEVVNLS